MSRDHEAVAKVGSLNACFKKGRDDRVRNLARFKEASRLFEHPLRSKWRGGTDSTRGTGLAMFSSEARAT